MPARIVPDSVISGFLSLANCLAIFTDMATINMHQAKTELSDLVARAEAGEEIIIARHNKPAVKLVPVEEAPKKPRVPGALAHLRGKIPDSLFFDPLPDEELKAWEGAYSFEGGKMPANET